MVNFTGVDGLGQTTATGAALLVDGTTAFTITGGPIRITDLVSYVIVGSDAAASTLKWAADGTVGSSTDFTGASGSLANLAAGGIVYCNFTTLSTAPVITQTNGVALYGPTTSTGGGIYVPAGIIKMVIGTANTSTATYKHYLRWLPLGPGTSVSAAF